MSTLGKHYVVQEDGTAIYVDPTPEEQAASDAALVAHQQREAVEAERLALLREKAAADPAFAALLEHLGVR